MQKSKKPIKKDNIYIVEETPEEKKRIRSTVGNKRIWNYFLDLLRDKSFQSHIVSIKKYNLDEEGKLKNITNFRRRISILCRKFGLDEIMWSEALEDYILKNKLPKENLSTPCIVLDRIEIGEDEYPDGFYEDEPDDMLKEPKELAPWSYSYPVIIRISPYASERVIIDYIKKFYTREIKTIQERYQNEEIRLGKVRRKKKWIQKRNAFIYRNKEKSYKEIRRLLAEKKIYVDDGLIGKIISMENKRRK